MDLSKREVRNRSLPRQTFRRETTMPRQGTDLPAPEVNARIHRPDTSGADELTRILGLANTVGQKILGDIQEGKDTRDAADALLDFASDQKDDKRFTKSRAYRNAWQKAGAKKMALDISQEVSIAVEERLNDEDDPATIEDINEIVEGIFRSRLLDEQGQPLNLITPEAKAILGNALAEVKSTIMPKAQEAIREQQNSRFLGTHLENFLVETQRGSEIGAPVQVDVKDFTPVPEGWSGNVADAIEELGMGPSEAAEFIETGKDPRASSAPPAPPPPPKRTLIKVGRPTGRPPHSGTVTSTFSQHNKRGSAGVDIAGNKGDPIEAPAGGRVIKVDNNPDQRSGRHVIIDHGGGVTSSYSHLEATSVKPGDVVRPGQRIALMGNSGNTRSRTGGDGTHLHWRVKVKGKDVDPLSFSFNNAGTEIEGVVAQTGAEPELVSEATAKVAFPTRNVDPERFLRELPPSISKAQGKAFLIQGLINKANVDLDPSWLEELENSTRADGSPSFNPKEVATIISAREQIGERARTRAERAERDRHQENVERIIEAVSYTHLTLPTKRIV